MKKVIYIIFSFLIVSSLTICNSYQVNAGTESAINVYSADTALAAPPSVIMEYHDGDEIEVFAQSVSSALTRPTTLIAEIDSDMNVKMDGGKIPYETFRVKYIKSKMLPAVRVESVACADALIAYLSDNEHNFIDFSVVSTQSSLVKKVRDVCPSIRGIIDCVEISGLSAGEVANLLNENKALTVILDISKADYNFIFDIQARFKSVWVRCSVQTDYDVYKSIATGAAGIVSDEYARIYDVYKMFQKTTISRGFYPIGHRGLPTIAGENTLEGMIAAYEAGATHFEVDAKVCKSGEIVLMHDDGLETTTNGQGIIYNLTLDEIKRYQVVRNSDGKQVPPSQIPTLDEVFTYFKGKDVVIIVETKNTQTHYPAALAQLVAKHNIADQVVAIGFGLKELGFLKEQVPQIPTANLNGTTKKDFLTYLAQLQSLNCTADPSKSGFMNESWLFKNSFARGYVPYNWTFSTAAENDQAVVRGCAGITTDCADSLGKYAKYILTDFITVENFQDNKNSFSIDVKTYNGKKESRDAYVLSAERVSENMWNVIFGYEDGACNRIAPPIVVKQEKNIDLEPQPELPSSDSKENGNGCAGQIDVANSMLLVGTVLGIFVLFCLKLNRFDRRKK